MLGAGSAVPALPCRQETATLLRRSQLTIPGGSEEKARQFYCQTLGLPEIEKPATLLGRGGLWLQVGDGQVHLGVEDGVDRRLTKVHIAYEVTDLSGWRAVRGPAADELFAHAPPQNRVNGMGTGIIIDPRGYIITNQHVVDDVSVIRVHLSDGRSHSGRVLTRDPESDLALLKIDIGRPLPTIPLGTSSDVMVGETVIAIGKAYGYEHSVTVGVVTIVASPRNSPKFSPNIGSRSTRRNC